MTHWASVCMWRRLCFKSLRQHDRHLPHFKSRALFRFKIHLSIHPSGLHNKIQVDAVGRGGGGGAALTKMSQRTLRPSERTSESEKRRPHGGKANRDAGVLLAGFVSGAGLARGDAGEPAAEGETGGGLAGEGTRQRGSWLWLRLSEGC